MITWLKRLAARTLLRASSKLLEAGVAICDDLPPVQPDPGDEDEGEDEDLPAPPQTPLTDASRAMMVERRPARLAPPEPDPPLAGSARERYANARKRHLN